MNRQAYLILSHKDSEALINSYHRISSANKEYDDTIILFHKKNGEFCDRISDVRHYLFTDSILNTFNYLPLGDSLVPGNNHFPLLKFFVDFPFYQYYWLIEDDVKFSGNWQFFFQSFYDFKADLISSHIKGFDEDPAWPWWTVFFHPIHNLGAKERLRAFNPIYRISGSALRYIHECLMDQWRGHHEILLPTLLHNGGFEIMDFGGVGRFVLPGFENKFYVEKKGSPKEDTMRWRPIFKTIGIHKNKLYHPVKE